MAAHGDIRIGISGWNYPPWRGVFYPAKLAHRRELEFASRAFNSVEVNGTFYSLQRPSSFARWAEATPDDFVFAIKGSRFITHMLKLRNVEPALANFLASGMLGLGRKLGPFLWQFGPNMRFQEPLFDEFFTLLPRDTEAAAEQARLHNERLKGRAFFEIDRRRPLRHAVEIRHDSFIDAKFIALLRKHRIGLVCADTVEWPLLMDVTADFVYCRLHGSEQLYASGYSRTQLELWAERVVAWARGCESPDGRRASQKPARKRATRDVYVYFDNDMKVRAPFDAKDLAAIVARKLEDIRD